MSSTPAKTPAHTRLLTADAFQQLADVPPEFEWFANLGNAHTRRGYERALRDFMRFTGIARPEEFRIVTRAHVIAWRDDLKQRGLGAVTVRHRMSALASLFEYLCDQNAVTHNPSRASSVRPSRPMKARRQPSAITRRASCCARPMATR